MFCVTALVDNSVSGRDLQAEHGLAILVQRGEDRVLFDAGQSELVARNARTLGVDLERLNAIAFSHGHYDHTGGLTSVGKLAPRARLYLHPAAVNARYAPNPQAVGPGSRALGMSTAGAELIRGAGTAVVWTTQPTEIAEGFFVTGEIPRRTDFEDAGGRFFLDADCRQPDPFADDQALFFDTHEGLVVILGCAHAGVVNTVEYIRQIAGGRPIYALLGGMHLLNAREERLRQTVDAFRRWEVQRIAAGHCTGLPAIVRLWSSFPERCFAWAAGSRMVFQAPRSTHLTEASLRQAARAISKSHVRFHD